MTAYNRINGTVGPPEHGHERNHHRRRRNGPGNMEISESVIMKQADQKMYENKKKFTVNRRNGLSPRVFSWYNET